MERVKNTTQLTLGTTGDRRGVREREVKLGFSTMLLYGDCISHCDAVKLDFKLILVSLMRNFITLFITTNKSLI